MIKQAVPEAATICPRRCKLTFKFNLLHDLENGVRVTCYVGFICANFSLPRRLLLISKRKVRYWCLTSLTVAQMISDIHLNCVKRR